MFYVIYWLLVWALGVTLMVFFMGQLGFLKGKAPTNLGVVEGRLKPPAKTPNSVSSQASLYPDHPQRDYANIAPIAFTGDAKAAFARLAAIVAALPGTTVVETRDDYLYAQCSTRWLQFTDDLELSLDAAAKLVHVRSASRLGLKDFGANRARVEAIRAAFAS